MSKEQTPITAEGLYDDKMGSDSVWKEDCVELMEQYTKAKVLEALEPQKEFIIELLAIFDGNGVPNIRYVTELIKNYYETEVQPKYQNKE